MSKCHLISRSRRSFNRQAIRTIPHASRNRSTAEGQLAVSHHAGKKIIVVGNGGSAADAQHIAAELSGRFMKDRKPLYAEALHVNSSYLTAVSNDYGFEKTYSRMIEASGKSGDILLALSTSGNSANVIQALKKANELEIPLFVTKLSTAEITIKLYEFGITPSHRKTFGSCRTSFENNEFD